MRAGLVDERRRHRRPGPHSTRRGDAWRHRRRRGPDQRTRDACSAAPPPDLLGAVAREDAEGACPGLPGRCGWSGRRPGSTRATGEVIERYSSAQELDGITWVRCGDRRAARCESCSREYKGDAWHLLSAGLAGGKGAPESVTDAPDDVRHADRAVVRAGARPPAGRSVSGPA